MSEYLDAAKQKLVALAAHNNGSGCGVAVTRFWKAGSVDYKKAPELQAIDLERYRGSGRVETRVPISMQQGEGTGLFIAQLFSKYLALRWYYAVAAKHKKGIEIL